MIPGFEKYTYPLTKDEVGFIDTFKNYLATKQGKDSSVTSKEMIAHFQDDFKLNGPRIRKLINHLRLSGKLKNIVSTSQGYWIGQSAEEVLTCANSISHRATSQFMVAKALKNQAKKL